jgi:hypothetical protein
MTALHTLGILSTSFIRNAFPTVLTEFSHMLSTCWLPFLHSVFQLIPNHLSWVEVGWLCRPGHLMQHSITLLLGQISLTQPESVLGHYPVEKEMIVPLSANQMGWCIAAECFCSVPWILNKSLTAKHPHTSHFLLHASRWEPHIQRSSVHLHCVSQRRAGWNQKSKNLDSSEQRKHFHQSNVHCSCFLAQSRLIIDVL